MVDVTKLHFMSKVFILEAIPIIYFFFFLPNIRNSHSRKSVFIYNVLIVKFCDNFEYFQVSMNIIHPGKYNKTAITLQRIGY